MLDARPHRLHRQPHGLARHGAKSLDAQNVMAGDDPRQFFGETPRIPQFANSNRKTDEIIMVVVVVMMVMVTILPRLRT